DYTAKGIDAYADASRVTDYFKTFGASIVFTEPGGFSAQVAFLLQNGSGDDPRVPTRSANGRQTGVTLDTSLTGGVALHNVEDGFRVYAGAFYRQPNGLGLTLGLSAGMV